jgi:hypothetical protein
MAGEGSDAAGYRVVTLVQQDPPPEVLRHARMLPGETGRYARVVRFRHDLSKTIYEVLHFKAGRPPTREEVLNDLRADLAALEARMAAARDVGGMAGWMDRRLFSGAARKELENQRQDILETIAAVEEDYRPGEAVKTP